MNTFMNNLEKTTSCKYTENGAVAVDTTTNALVDLFGVLGALRPRDEREIVDKFNRAYSEDYKLATKMVFYARDVRAGLGERRTGRLMLKALANQNPKLVENNIDLIPYFGRFDDLLELFGTPCEDAMLKYVKTTLFADMAALKANNLRQISLLAKWLPSVNTSSAHSRSMARKLCNALRMSEASYRKTLSKLRAAIDVVERKMSSGQWSDIRYSAVPSNAMNIHAKAFARNDATRFSEYLEDLKSGKTKVNAATLYPYNIVQKIFNGSRDDILDAQWKALPNYVEGENNYLVMADVSGSMSCDNYIPMATSIGLAIYFAERNKGAFAGKYMTFSASPQIVSVAGKNIYQKVCNVAHTDVGYDTNLEAAFMAVLDTAVRTNCAVEDMPKSIIIVTDMEINDYSIDGGNFTFLDEMKQRFATAGYELPNVVFWNVHARHDTFHAFENDSRVQLVSGHAVSTFKLVMDSFNYTPYETMLKALNNERYDCIRF